MKTEQLLILQFIAHLLTDYTFQSGIKAKEKNEFGFKSKFLKWHVLLAFLFSWILSLQYSFVYGAFIIALSHMLIDGLKVYLNRSRQLGRYAYFIDQSLHLAIIVAVVCLYSRFFIQETVFELSIRLRYLAAAAGFLLCSKPANILIREILGAFDIRVRKTGTEESELPNAGKLIGITERWLIMIFIIVNQFGAIGFLLAAKSIMRFKDDETLKAEYLLAGTLISFSIAIGAGLAVRAF